MKLQFVYGNKQRKNLVESDFADDIFDVIISFFEGHGAFPHVLFLKREEDNAKIEMPNTPEHFLISGVDDESFKELEELVSEYQR